jgi:hypothetical protein
MNDSEPNGKKRSPDLLYSYRNFYVNAVLICYAVDQTATFV